MTTTTNQRVAVELPACEWLKVMSTLEMRLIRLEAKLQMVPEHGTLYKVLLTRKAALTSAISAIRGALVNAW